MPPESRAEQDPEWGNVIHSLHGVVYGDGLLPSVPRSLVNSWGVGILSYSFPPLPSRCPKCLSQYVALGRQMGSGAHYRLAGRDRNVQM